ncbi:carotenoid ester lipase precursor [Dentipellis sp. KUC8613]|nr:carotenoid ester lipase precursor [Dentipellis sp. KUC8613]
MRRSIVAAFALHAAAVGAAPQTPLAALAPTIMLDQGVFEGQITGQTAQFLGIPYAEPPVGDLRLRRPQAPAPYTGRHDASKFGPTCPQQAMSLPSEASRIPALADAISAALNTMYERSASEDENCLTINVIKPATMEAGTKLPVLVWIFGGGFQIGGTATYGEAAQLLVERSILLQKPAIYVSMNYRLSALGWLASREVQAENVANLGLWDQRLALEWVQKYIDKFGGDPTKVTIWGESAGAISVAMHMLSNGGEPQGLFRAAVMQSGGPIPVAGVENGQRYYDDLVRDTGCDGQPDTLGCLRAAPFASLKAAMDKSPNFFSYQGLALPYLPRVDGDFIKESPLELVKQGKVAKVPMITGNCDDEGSLFSLGSLNLSTTADTRQFLKRYMLPNASADDVKLMLQYYPDIPHLGCPFDTGLRNMLSIQFKRIAAIQGDVAFHSPRRFLLKHTAGTQPSWSFLSKRGKDTAYLGATHATDLANSYGPSGELRDYILNFATNLDPNAGGSGTFKWPRYNPNTGKPQALVFDDSVLSPVNVKHDDYRPNALEFVANLSLSNSL